MNVTFKELVHRIVDRIKNDPYFRCLNKMENDPSRRNQNLYYTYHRDKGHATKKCRVVKAGYLNEFVVDPRNHEVG